MNLKQALAAFPAKSAYRKILPGLLSKNEKVWRKAYEHLGELERLTDTADPMATTWNLSESEALALLNAAVSLPFAPPKHEWEDAVHELIFPLVRSPHPSLLPIARDAYPRLTDRAKCALLSLIGACGTRAAAEAFLACIREHGWPAGIYRRVFLELPKLLDHADLLFPELIQLAGPHVGGVTDVLLAGLANGKVNLTAGSIDLEPIAALAVKELKRLLKSAKKHQRPGIAWRFSEKYFYVRQQAGCWLDLAGYLKEASLSPLLKECFNSATPGCSPSRAPRPSAGAAGSARQRSIGSPLATKPESCCLSC